MTTPAGIGVSVRQVEDNRFITGRGTYTDDIDRPGQTYGWFARSTHAAAKIKSVNAKKALAMPGVVAVQAGADVVEDEIGGLPCGWPVKSKDGTPMTEPSHPPHAIEISYEPLKAVVDALDPLGTIHLEMPATSQNVWNALQSAKKKAAD